MQDGKIRCTWISWDPELLAALPADVAAQFPVVLNSGCAMHKPLFVDLMREVAGGKRSFEEWTRSLRHHQYQVFYTALQQWLSYELRCRAVLQPLSTRSSAEPVAVAAVTAPEAVQPAAATSGAGTAAGAANKGAAAVTAGAAAPQGQKAQLPSAVSSLGRPPSKKAKQQQQQQPGPRQATLFMFNTIDASGRKRSASAARGSAATGTAAASCGEAVVSGVVSPAVPGSSLQPNPAAAAATAGGSSRPAAAPVAAAGSAAAGSAAAGSAAAGSAAAGSAAGAGSSKRKAAALDSDDRLYAGFGEFDDADGWCGYVPSTASVIGLFLKCSTSDVAVAVFQQLRVGGTIWKGDHNYKFTKCVRKNGETVYAAVFTIMNVSCLPICFYYLLTYHHGGSHIIMVAGLTYQLYFSATLSWPPPSLYGYIMNQAVSETCCRGQGHMCLHAARR
jgi:hypothetical protein